MTTGITDLAAVLVDLGVDIRRSGGREISGCCPVHLKKTGHIDRSPSWSMNAETGAWICYSCGSRGSLYNLIAELTGDTQTIWDIHSFLIQAGLDRINTEQVEYQPPVDWITYNKFSDVPTHLLEQRSLDPQIARRHGVKWNPETKAWVLPIISKDGELLGWQEKKTGWVRNYPIGVKKSNTLFGVERFNPSSVAVLVESPLDVVRIASTVGHAQGLATFGAHVSKTQLDILSSVSSKVIIAMDNDSAGIESGMRLWKSLPRFRDGVLWIHYKHTNAKDIGDMNDKELEVALNSASVLPWWLL